MDDSNTCIICCNRFNYYCCGACAHPICLYCCARIRLLSDSKECPICRSDIDEVFVTKKLLPQDRLMTMQSSFNRNNPFTKQGFVFQTRDGLESLFQILANYCPVDDCKHRNIDYANMSALQNHVRRDHELFYCELCLEHLNLFSWERKCYTRQELAAHRRKGDPDDTSHRGHPQCEFCDTRFMDKDHLFRHLRTDHFFCHFCDADGINQFYDLYSNLRDHFMNGHFLCEEGACRDEQFTNAYRSEISLKAHKTQVHGQGMQKSQLRQERVLNLEFNYTPATLESFGGPRNRDGRGGRRGGRGHYYQGRSSRPLEEGTSGRENFGNGAGASARQPAAEFANRQPFQDGGGSRRGRGGGPGRQHTMPQRRRGPLLETNGPTDSQQSTHPNHPDAAARQESFKVQDPSQDFPVLSGAKKSARSSAASGVTKGEKGGKNQDEQPLRELGTRSMANAVRQSGAPMTRSGSLDKHEFPTLGLAASAQQATRDSRRDSLGSDPPIGTSTSPDRNMSDLDVPSEAPVSPEAYPALPGAVAEMPKWKPRPPKPTAASTKPTAPVSSAVTKPAADDSSAAAAKVPHPQPAAVVAAPAPKWNVRSNYPGLQSGPAPSVPPQASRPDAFPTLGGPMEPSDANYLRRTFDKKFQPTSGAAWLRGEAVRREEKAYKNKIMDAVSAKNAAYVMEHGRRVAACPTFHDNSTDSSMNSLVSKSSKNQPQPANHPTQSDGKSNNGETLNLFNDYDVIVTRKKVKKRMAAGNSAADTDGQNSSINLKGKTTSNIPQSSGQRREVGSDFSDYSDDGGPRGLHNMKETDKVANLAELGSFIAPGAPSYLTSSADQSAAIEPTTKPDIDQPNNDKNPKHIRKAYGKNKNDQINKMESPVASASSPPKKLDPKPNSVEKTNASPDKLATRRGGPDSEKVSITRSRPLGPPNAEENELPRGREPFYRPAVASQQQAPATTPIRPRQPSAPAQPPPRFTSGGPPGLSAQGLANPANKMSYQAVNGDMEGPYSSNTVPYDALLQQFSASNVCDNPILPPPGLQHHPMAAPQIPPGISYQPRPSNPPPGFSPLHQAAPRSNIYEQLNEFHPTALPPPQSEQPPPAVLYPPYLKSNGSSKRNHILFQQIEQILGKKGIEAFKLASGRYRRSGISADAYAAEVERLFTDKNNNMSANRGDIARQMNFRDGNEAFNELVPELIVLLPDIGLQRSLRDAVGRLAEDTTHWDTINPVRLTECLECGQLLGTAKADIEEHQRAHIGGD